MKTLLAAAAITAALSFPASAQTFLGASGYVLKGHVGTNCAMVYLSPSITSPDGGYWFSIDISSASTLTPQAASAQVTIVSNAASSELLLQELGVTPPKLGVDYNPSAPQVDCVIDEEGGGTVPTVRVVDFNYPASPAQ